MFNTVQTDVANAEFQCTLLGGHLPSLHTWSQAEHLQGVYLGLWAKYAYGQWDDPNVWLGYQAHAASSTDSYNYNYSPPNGTHVGWSDWSANDWPNMTTWGSYSYMALFLRDPNPNSAVRRLPNDSWGGWSAYACACKCLHMLGRWHVG